ncbi:MAG: dihydrolipoyl dehydrogenase [Flammeovirgaceae bacterium]|jgi:dihydrolipoamide dehydrogenase|nr:dihydrolipoyl dehydrogenase [Flammeovirgaceae bacterium]|tara:strand:- start:2019 stop:3407 length:1389 start_codon:yes stop_codon:yes gene_type:complete
MSYNLIVIGSGPGGYVAAIRASQLGMKVAVVEKESLGGICLNWGCIPTKALLKSAQVFDYVNHSESYGIKIKDSSIDFDSIINRSRGVADGMSKGVNFLMKKNKIDILKGFGKIISKNEVEVTANDKKKNIHKTENIIVATGGRPRELQNVKIDGKKIIEYRKAMTLENQPKKMVVIGSGAIGSEFAYFYNSIGTDVTLVEYLPNILPLEDIDVSKQLEKSFKKAGVNIMTNTEVLSVDTKGKGCKVNFKSGDKEDVIHCDIVLSAVGVQTNIDNIGLEENGIIIENGKINVDDYYQTNIEGVYAIGDVVKGPALAHVASAEGIICVEKIGGLNPSVLNYDNIPSCTYCSPEVASVGFSEKQAIDLGYDIKVGKFPFTASGKANASGHSDGFVKVIFDKKYGEWLGCHMIGYNVTEMIAEVVAARKLETTAHEIIKSVHPHPTMSEAIMEATAAAYDEVIHL